MTDSPAPFAPPKADQECPCGSGQPFAGCCRPILAGERPAATAEALMRSRFTAHVARDYRHLHRTYLPTSQEPYIPEDDPAPRTWTRLVIHDHQPAAKPDMATVDFTAYFQEGDQEQALHEKAEFKRIEGAWFYTGPIRQGPAPIRTTQAKVGRNDPCPCGSGKKYKQCCLKKG